MPKIGKVYEKSKDEEPLQLVEGRYMRLCLRDPVPGTGPPSSIESKY
ncbi:MAG: hypothetical protein QXG15_02410 [Desulfurococcaceae archaeon]